MCCVVVFIIVNIVEGYVKISLKDKLCFYNIL